MLVLIPNKTVDLELEVHEIDKNVMCSFDES